MKKILMLGTGGTIASEITESGLSPQLTTEQILHYCPDISAFCRVDCRQLCNLDSTNIDPQHWQMMADAIREEYDRYDGFVLTHGTDTMAYTAAALCYLIQYSKKPIVLTGSQKPINLEITDSKTNLVDAFHYAASEDAHGVSIVFNGRGILGTRARKTHSKSFQAFSSINYPELAVIQDGRLLSYIEQEFLDHPIFCERLDPNVGLIKLVPGLEADFLEFMLERKDGVVIESIGVGGYPLGYQKADGSFNSGALGKWGYVWFIGQTNASTARSLVISGTSLNLQTKTNQEAAKDIYLNVRCVKNYTK